jgi:DNA-binding transcriptional ArsR family regulator
MSTSPGDVFQALSDPNRRHMLDLLVEEERPVGEIAEHFEISFQGVSQHLGVLANAGLVVRRKKGRFRYYRANPEALKEVDAWLGRYRKFWRGRLARLDQYLDESD